MEGDPEAKKAALGALGRIAFEELRDTARAARAFDARVAADPKDLEAWNGLEGVYDAAGQHVELVGVLDARARLVPERQARADRVRVARLYAENIGDPGAAIEAWRGIRRDFGADDESFDALSRLLQSESRWDELADTVADAAARADGAKRRELYRVLGDLHRDRTGKPDEAVEAYVRANDFERTLTVVDVLTDRELAIAVASRLLSLASSAWKAADAGEFPAVAAAARCAIETLVRRHLEGDEGDRVVETQLFAASLPFERSERRRYKREAAWTSCDRLDKPEHAIRILDDLFAEDPSDDVASASVTVSPASSPRQVARKTSRCSGSGRRAVAPKRRIERPRRCSGRAPAESGRPI